LLFGIKVRLLASHRTWEKGALILQWLHLKRIGSLVFKKDISGLKKIYIS
jgi:hypothetical protein